MCVCENKSCCLNLKKSSTTYYCRVYYQTCNAQRRSHQHGELCTGHVLPVVLLVTVQLILPHCMRSLAGLHCCYHSHTAKLEGIRLGNNTSLCSLNVNIKYEMLSQHYRITKKVVSHCPVKHFERWVTTNYSKL